MHINTAKPTLIQLLIICSLALGMSTAVLAINTDLPDLGNSAGSIMTPTQERKLGQAFMRSIRASRKVIDDPLINDYIQSLGQKLVNSSEDQGRVFHFFIIDDPQINAFAGPGGHIGVYSGLIQTTDTESELAAVLAHEISHVTQLHLLRTWEATSNMGATQAAILIAAVVLGAAIGGDAGLAAATVGQGALIQEQINFTRTNEKEADRLGIKILAEAGYEPRAMPSFFARMGRANRVYATKIPEFLLTHPVTTARTADGQGRAEKYPYKAPPSDLRYQLAREALRIATMRNPAEAAVDQNKVIEEGRFRNESAARYARVLANMRLNHYREAAAELDLLLKKHPDTIEFVVTRARIDTYLGNSKSALQRLNNALLKNPGSYALNLAVAQSSLDLGKASVALNHLQQYIEYRPQDPHIFTLLARAAGDSGDQLLGHEYLAMKHYYSGELEQATLQLEIALKRPDVNFYDASRLESLLEEFKREQGDKKKKSRIGNKLIQRAS